MSDLDTIFASHRRGRSRASRRRPRVRHQVRRRRPARGRRDRALDRSRLGARRVRRDRLPRGPLAGPPLRQDDAAERSRPFVPRPWTTVEPSEAVFYRRIAADPPTILLDEVDAIFNKKSEATEGLRACLNAGNQRGTTVPRCQPPRMEIVEFEVFCREGARRDRRAARRRSPTARSRSRCAARSRATGSSGSATRKAREVAAPLAAELEQWADGAVAERARPSWPGRTSRRRGRPARLARRPGVGSRRGSRCSPSPRSPASAWLATAIAAAVALSGSRDDELDDRRQPSRRHQGRLRREPDPRVAATYELLDALLADRGEPLARLVVGPALGRGEAVEGGAAEARADAEAVRDPPGRRLDAERQHRGRDTGWTTSGTPGRATCPLPMGKKGQVGKIPTPMRPRALPTGTAKGSGRLPIGVVGQVHPRFQAVLTDLTHLPHR